MAIIAIMHRNTEVTELEISNDKIAYINLIMDDGKEILFFPQEKKVDP